MGTMATLAEAAAREYTPYDPKQVEEKWYRFWLERGYFKPETSPSFRKGPPFTIIMPPPNVTGELHMGHAIFITLEDILVRWKRMQGYPTLWLPGRDHAGIAGQFVVEKLLAQEGKTRHDLGREKFLERVWDWMNRYGTIIRFQMQRLGASADWDRERFTMDPGPSRAVRTAFVRLYEKGLIYRGNRITNWCPRCYTALSDLEVTHREVQGQLSYVRYPLVPREGGRRRKAEMEYITVATTRPETILADTAIAVHPDDARYRKLVGRKAIVPHVEREIPIVADEAVDPAFGTGAVKVTPGHDPVDFEIGQRHHLPTILVMNLDGTMNDRAGAYAGMTVGEARKRFLQELEERGLLVKVEPHVHAVGHCDRCGTVVEPIVTDQWYVKIQPLAEPAIQAVQDGRIRIIPERFTKVYFNWMENIRDWCISRQLWWGHRIPVWYCQDCRGMTVAVDDPERCVHCGGTHLDQDPDVLDTWFSSALWTFSTLGWPDETPDLRYFYPGSVMETGYDILFFWVARMIMMGLEFMGDVPFRDVFLHGLVRVGREKMAKVKGNVQDPLDISQQYGTDALRLALVKGTTPGNDVSVTGAKYESSRDFVNKLWNAGRFVLTKVPYQERASLAGAPLERLPGASLPDRWIVSRANRLVADVTRLMDSYLLGEAMDMLHDFVWFEYCDWYLEMAKVHLREAKDEAARSATRRTLAMVLETVLRLLHPCMPFVTEELWQALVRPDLRQGAGPESIMVAPWPVYRPELRDEEAEEETSVVVDMVRGIRNLRAEYRVDWAKWVPASIEAGGRYELIVQERPVLEAMGRLRPLEVAERIERKPAHAITLVAGGVSVLLPPEGMFDVAAEIRRLEEELQRVRREIERGERLLATPGFVQKAPPEVVEREREKLEAQRHQLARLQEHLAALR